MNIYDILNKRRYVMDYDKTAKIDKNLINDLLEKTWKVTPSKNNFMPYKVHAIGPKHQRLKHSIFEKCLVNEGDHDGVDVNERYNIREHMPNYRNILTCSYLLIFTLRHEPEPNPFQKWLIEQGHDYPAADEDRIEQCWGDALVEVGMFSAAFGAMCLEHDIDIAPVGCFPRDLDKWRDVPFVTCQPLSLLTVGKGEVYRQDVIQNTKYEKHDWKPNFNKVVNIL